MQEFALEQRRWEICGQFQNTNDPQNPVTQSLDGYDPMIVMISPSGLRVELDAAAEAGNSIAYRTYQNDTLRDDAYRFTETGYWSWGFALKRNGSIEYETPDNYKTLFYVS